MRLYSVYYISVGSSKCFGCCHPSSGAGTAVITASGVGQPDVLPSALVVGFQLTNENGWQKIRLISTTSCNYSCTSYWWWVSTPETCRAAYRNVINWIQSHLFGQLLNSIHNARTRVYKKPLAEFANLIFFNEISLWRLWMFTERMFEQVQGKRPGKSKFSCHILR